MRFLLVLWCALAIGTPALAEGRRTQCSLAVAPVEISLTRLDAVAPGQGFRVRLDAEAKADCGDVQLDLELPAGASFVAGSPSWRGALAKGERHQRELTVSVPDLQIYAFTAVVTVRRGSALLVRQYALTVGPIALRQRPRAIPAVTAPDGTRMLVLPAREVAR